MTTQHNERHDSNKLIQAIETMTVNELKIIILLVVCSFVFSLVIWVLEKFLLQTLSVIFIFVCVLSDTFILLFHRRFLIKHKHIFDIFKRNDVDLKNHPQLIIFYKKMKYVILSLVSFMFLISFLLSEIYNSSNICQKTAFVIPLIALSYLGVTITLRLEAIKSLLMIRKK